MLSRPVISKFFCINIGIYIYLSNLSISICLSTLYYKVESGKCKRYREITYGMEFGEKN